MESDYSSRGHENGSLRNEFDKLNRKVAELELKLQKKEDWTADHIKIEEALRESGEYLNQIVNCIGDHITVKNEDLKVALVNDAYCKFHHQHKEDLIGTAGFKDMAQEAIQSLNELDARVIRSGKEILLEETLLDDSGKQHTFMSKKSVFTDKKGQKHLVLVGRDITEYKRMEAQFLQSQKMEAIGALAGGIAHDFNNLLNVINGYSEVILNNQKLDAQIRKDIEQIRDAGARAVELTSQLLSFSRKQLLQPEILDLHLIITQMNSMLRRIIGEDVELIVNRAPDLGTIQADPAKIQQVILNLAVNARDAMPQGGKIVIETANIEFDEESIKAQAMIRPGKYVMLAMTDTGTGMTPEIQSRVFEPFFTTKEKGKGTGIGLSTVYGIVNQSNGFIWVYSEPGKGSTFKIYFPLAEAEAEPSSQAVEKARPDNGSETILLVEDESSVRFLANRILQDRGYTVIQARDGADALRLAAAFPDIIHLIVTDVVMPGMSGRALVDEIAKIRPTIRSLFVSGYADDAIVHHGILDANVEFLPKPFSVKQLATKVREILNA